MTVLQYEGINPVYCWTNLYRPADCQQEQDLEPVHDLCKVIKKPVLAIYGVAKPAQASSLGLGFAPCSSPKHAFSSLLTKIVNMLMRKLGSGPAFSHEVEKPITLDVFETAMCAREPSLS
jgi:hypothetical protein